MKVVIVDDSNIARMSARRTLGQAGFADLKLYDAKNSIEALSLISAEQPDLVLCDWNLPRKAMTGLDLIKVLRNQGSTVRFGFVSEQINEATQERAYAAGAQFVLPKPFSANDLTEAMTESDEENDEQQESQSSGTGIPLEVWVDATEIALERMMSFILGIDEFEIITRDSGGGPNLDGGGYISITTANERIQLGLAMDSASRMQVVRTLLARRPSDPDPHPDEVEDAVRELVNIVAGLVKTELVNQGDLVEVELSTPFFLYGRIVAVDAMRDRFVHIETADNVWTMQVLRSVESERLGVAA